jgi:ribosome-associated toxin RatA of RatAB toxin-antitoxin module
MPKVRSSCSDAPSASRSRVLASAAIALLLVAGCAGSGMSAVEGHAAASPAPAARLAEIPLTSSSTDAQRTSADEDEIEPVAVPIAASDLVRGRATVEVRAPIQAVRDAVLGFSRYPSFMPHYETCKVLGRTASGGRDVYMEISALHGAMNMWVRVEVTKATEGDVEVVGAKLVDGNVEDFAATWRLRRLDPSRTELSLEVFLKPRLPLPAAILNEENLKGAVKGAAAMRVRAERAPSSGE